ncbi:MAG: hypothetical protein RIQ81_109 [Pseudomonadota bacterium]|jgi:shikimate dehydrogenase
MSVNRIMQLGLIGRGIHYSLSPVIHQTAARWIGIEASYQLHDLNSADEVRRFLRLAWEDGACGFNVTQPWKLLFGSVPVNTLYRAPHINSWSTTSTDGEGFLKGLSKIGCVPASIRRMIFLGAGAVVSSIVDAVSRECDVAPEVHCLHRNAPGTAQERSTWHSHGWNPSALARLLAEHCPGTILIQATPLPLLGDPMAGFADTIAKHRQSGQLWVVDLCYGKHSLMVDMAAGEGIPAQDGLPMLIEQARSAQEIWWGKSAPYETLEEACLTSLRQRG